MLEGYWWDIFSIFEGQKETFLGSRMAWSIVMVQDRDQTAKESRNLAIQKAKDVVAPLSGSLECLLR